MRLRLRFRSTLPSRASGPAATPGLLERLAPGRRLQRLPLLGLPFGNAPGGAAVVVPRRDGRSGPRSGRRAGDREASPRTPSSPRLAHFLVPVHPLVGQADERLLGRGLGRIGGHADRDPEAGVDPLLLEEGVPLDQLAELLGQGRAPRARRSGAGSPRTRRLRSAPGSRSRAPRRGSGSPPRAACGCPAGGRTGR